MHDHLSSGIAAAITTMLLPTPETRSAVRQNDSRGNKPDRFTADFWRLNAPKCSRVFLRHRSVIMAPEHRGDFIRHFIRLRKNFGVHETV
jgi:hypothetical protein